MKREIRLKNSYELIPYVTARKSFNHKAIVNIMDNGIKCLVSYDTLVCVINTKGKLVKTWDDWSVTTAMHIDSFLKSNGLKAISKKEWQKMKVSNRYSNIDYKLKRGDYTASDNPNFGYNKNLW